MFFLLLQEGEWNSQCVTYQGCKKPNRPAAAAGSRLLEAITDTSQGTFKPNREKDKLTNALKNPMHTSKHEDLAQFQGRTLGPSGSTLIGVTEESMSAEEEKL